MARGKDRKVLISNQSFAAKLVRTHKTAYALQCEILPQHGLQLTDVEGRSAPTYHPPYLTVTDGQTLSEL